MDNIIPYLKIFFIPEEVIPAIVIGVVVAVILFFSFKKETKNYEELQEERLILIKRIKLLTKQNR